MQRAWRVEQDDLKPEYLSSYMKLRQNGTVFLMIKQQTD
jgi:hypothetical protein